MPSQRSSRSIRIFAILHLCIVFTLLFWYGGYPFMGEHYEWKNKNLVYKTVLGESEATLKISAKDKEKLDRNRNRFISLPEDIRLEIKQGYQKMSDKFQRPWLGKTADSIRIIAYELPLFLKAWLFFSIVAAILILREAPGSRAAIWLLPALAFFFAMDNQMYGIHWKPTGETMLFPSEKAIIEQYLSSPLSNRLFEQQRQLRRGWHNYLLRNWSKDDAYASEEEAIESAEFNFNQERARRIGKDIVPAYRDRFRTRRHPYLLAAFIFWNISFAFAGNGSLLLLKKYRKSAPAQNAWN